MEGPGHLDVQMSSYSRMTRSIPEGTYSGTNLTVLLSIIFLTIRGTMPATWLTIKRHASPVSCNIGMRCPHHWYRVVGRPTFIRVAARSGLPSVVMGLWPVGRVVARLRLGRRFAYRAGDVAESGGKTGNLRTAYAWPWMICPQRAINS